MRIERALSAGLLALALALALLGCNPPEALVKTNAFEVTGHVESRVTSPRKYFSYWDVAFAIPASTRSAWIDRQAGYADFTSMVNVRYDASTQRFLGDDGMSAHAVAAGMKLVVEAPLTGDGKLYAFDSWVEAVRALGPSVAGVYVFDEPGTADQLENILASSREIKAALPGVKTWLNLTGHGALVIPDVDPAIDVISFDCYGSFSSCAEDPWDGSIRSVPDVAKILESKLASAEQRLILVPPGCSATDLSPDNPCGVHLTEDELITQAGQYADLALSDPKIVALSPFLWQSGNGWRGSEDLPNLEAEWQRIAQRLHGNDSATPAPDSSALDITVVDASTGDPIEGAVVTVGPYSLATDAEGHVGGMVPHGTYEGSVSADGYPVVTGTLDHQGPEELTVKLDH